MVYSKNTVRTFNYKYFPRGPWWSRFVQKVSFCRKFRRTFEVLNTILFHICIIKYQATVHGVCVILGVNAVFTEADMLWSCVDTVFTKQNLACENIRFSSLFVAGGREKRMFSQAKQNRANSFLTWHFLGVFVCNKQICLTAGYLVPRFLSLVCW